MAAKKIGKYTILKTIGQGGMAKIYLAKVRGQKQPVILKKLILLSRKELIQRFQREAVLMHKFNHPNIVNVMDYFKAGGTYYIVMEYVDGISLDKLLNKRKCIPPQVGGLIFYLVCLGLEYAHKKRVIHRDIKPANVLIGKNGQVKLTDFGIATPGDKKERERLTKTGYYFGTPAYISPEQLDNAKHVDARSDIYSMGVMLYEMLTGEKPFSSNFNAETLANIYKGKYIKPQRHNSKIPGRLRSIISKAMRTKKEKRFPGMDMLIKAVVPYAKKYKTKTAIAAQIKNYLAGKKSK